MPLDEEEASAKRGEAEKVGAAAVSESAGILSTAESAAQAELRAAKERAAQAELRAAKERAAEAEAEASREAAGVEREAKERVDAASGALSAAKATSRALENGIGERETARMATQKEYDGTFIFLFEKRGQLKDEVSRLEKEIKEEAKKLEKADKAVEQASAAFDKQKAYADKQQQVASKLRADAAAAGEKSLAAATKKADSAVADAKKQAAAAVKGAEGAAPAKAAPESEGSPAAAANRIGHWRSFADPEDLLAEVLPADVQRADVRVRRTCSCGANGLVECGIGVGYRGACGPGPHEQVVIIPTVLKGLNNQRMRLVSDIVGAMLIGAAVQLPSMLATRRSCHFDVTCYKQYEPVLPIWKIFDRDATLSALNAAGACVVPPRRRHRNATGGVSPQSSASPPCSRRCNVHADEGGEPRPLRLPIAASQLERLAMTGRLVSSDGQPLRRISFGGPTDCCVLFVPDTLRARQLFRRVNNALITSTELRGVAAAALSRFRDSAGVGPGGHAHTLALHWRAETDMSRSEHILDTSAYRSGVIRALVGVDAEKALARRVSRCEAQVATENARVAAFADQAKMKKKGEEEEKEKSSKSTGGGGDLLRRVERLEASLSAATESGPAEITSRDLQCYFERYADLKFLQDKPKKLVRLMKHWKQHGQPEGRRMGCSTAAAAPPPPPPRRSLEERVGAIERLIGLEAEEAAEQHAAGQPNRTHVLVLGDQDEAATRVIELQLGSGLRVHSKATLLGSTVLRGMLSSELATMDDAVGMIDFEIGSRADRFIGAPFSSFSVMIALKRARRQLPVPPGSRYDVTLAARRSAPPDEHSPGTLMAAGADTADKLAAIFAVAFPFAAAIPEDPCKELVALHPLYARAGLASCPMRTFTVAKRSIAQSVPQCGQCGIQCSETPLVLSEMLGRYKRWRNCLPHATHACGCGDIDAATATTNLLLRRSRNTALTHIAVSETPLLWPRTVPERLSKRLLRPPPPPDTSSAGEAPRRGARCPHHAPRFVFEPPLDHGRSCTLVVATLTFGARESVEALDGDDAANLAAAEAREGVASCWFAFVDEEAFASMLPRTARANGTAAERASTEGAAGTSSLPEAPTAFSLYRIVPWGGWNLVVLSRSMLPFDDASLNSRVPKFLLHEAFASASYALYIDAKLHFYPRSLLGLWAFVDRALGEATPPPAWVSPRHPRRSSAYAEARCVVSVGLAPDELVSPQMAAYRAAGFPEESFEAGGPGLIEGEWHLRDLRATEQSAIGCAWLDEFVRRGHKRDQLSFNYVVWRLGLLPTQRGGRSRFVDSACPGSNFFLHVVSDGRLREHRNESKTYRGCDNPQR